MSQQPEGQTCENCRFGIEEVDGDRKKIYCRARGPIIGLNYNEGYADWPKVRREWWCGQYAPANPETVEEGAATLAKFVLLGDLTAARALADKLRE